VTALPHITIEYSANLDRAFDMNDLVHQMHEAALTTGVFELGGLRTRVARRDVYRIADGDAANAFVHVVVNIGYGRDLDARKRMAETLFKTLNAFLDPVYARAPLAISLEVTEIDPDLTFKRNNIHERLKSKRPG
jgi:5-carboxymethyl-2-hydroxymuconate isomerase